MPWLQTDVAIKLARRAIRIRHNTRPAWLLLSRCYVRHGLYGLSLVALNVVPAPPLPGQELVSGKVGEAWLLSCAPLISGWSVSTLLKQITALQQCGLVLLL